MGKCQGSVNAAGLRTVFAPAESRIESPPRGKGRMEQRQDGSKLQVAGAKPQDVGTGTARLSRKSMQALGAREGDVIEITGKRPTAALALPPYAEDEGLDVIRLDGLQRGNAGVSIGDHVDVRPADTRSAKRIQLAPAQKNLRLVGSGDMLRRTLFQRPLVAGDVISTSIYQRSQTGG